MKKVKRKDIVVMVFGVFDILHPGHLFFLEQAKKLGSVLVVVVTRDARVRMQKENNSTMSEQDRLRIVQSLRTVDRVLLGDTDIQKPTIIKRIQPDIIAIGYDQNDRHPMLLAQTSKLKKQPKVIRIKAFHPGMYSSTEYKKNALLS